MEEDDIINNEFIINPREGAGLSGIATSAEPLLAQGSQLADIQEIEPGAFVDRTSVTSVNDLFNYYYGGMPSQKPATDTAQIPGAADILVDAGSQDQATGDLTGNTQFEQNLIDEGAGVQIAPGQPVVAPAEIPVTQDEIDRYNLNTQFENYLLDEGAGVQIEPGAPIVAPGEVPLTSSDIEQFNNPALTQESTAEEIAQDFLDRQEAEQAAGRNLVDEAALTGITGFLPSIESLQPPAIQESLITPTNILTTLTGGILDIPLNLGITAAQAAMPTQPDLVDPTISIDEFAEEDNVNVGTNTQTPAEKIYESPVYYDSGNGDSGSGGGGGSSSTAGDDPGYSGPSPFKEGGFVEKNAKR
jgi:hypothetical protein